MLPRPAQPRGRSPCLAGFLPPFRPPAAEHLPSAGLIRGSIPGRPSQTALLFLKSRPLSRQGCSTLPAAVAFQLTQVKSAGERMRILKSKALVMNAFPPNWVREVIIWALTLNRAGLLLSRIVVHLPKNCPAVSAGRKPRLRAPDSAWRRSPGRARVPFLQRLPGPAANLRWRASFQVRGRFL